MNNELTLARGSVLRIEDGQDLVVHVREGSLWLTQERDRRDYYLGAGDSFRLDRDGLAIASATRPSRIALITREESHASRSAAS
jgi:hypothetical protein